MKRLRISIRALMVLVLFLAVGAAALRSASSVWASFLFTLTIGVLATAILGALFAGRPRRPFWAGVALFGWGSMILAFAPWFHQEVKPHLLTSRLAALAGPALPITFDQTISIDGNPVPSQPAC